MLTLVSIFTFYMIVSCRSDSVYKKDLRGYNFALPNQQEQQRIINPEMFYTQYKECFFSVDESHSAQYIKQTDKCITDYGTLIRFRHLVYQNFKNESKQARIQMVTNSILDSLDQNTRVTDWFNPRQNGLCSNGIGLCILEPFHVYKYTFDTYHLDIITEVSANLASKGLTIQKLSERLHQSSPNTDNAIQITIDNIPNDTNNINLISAINSRCDRESVITRSNRWNEQEVQQQCIFSGK